MVRKFLAMSILSRGFGYLRTKLRIDTSEGYYPGRDPFIRPLTPETVLGLSAVWASQIVIAGTISTLSLGVFNAKKNGEIQPATNHHLYNILKSDPNFDLTAPEFWEYMASAIELHGSAYARIVPSVREGEISSLLPVNPAVVTVRRLRSTGRLEYSYYDAETGTQRKVAQDKMLHIRGAFPTALGGQSPLQAAAGVFRSAHNADMAAGRQWAQGMRPSGVLSVDKPLDKAQRNKLKTILRSEYQGAINDGVPVILDNGVSWSQLSISAKDAQMLESRSFSVLEIARIFGVPPFMIGHTEKSTSWGTGLEQQVLAFIKFTLRRRVKRIEKALMKQLLTPQERSRGMYIKFNIEDLLRGDTVARANFYEKMTRNGLMTINEVRDLEDRPAIDGGGVARVQMQNIPVAEADGSITGGEDNVDE